MSILAIILTLVLCAIALLHILWGIGIWFPLNDEGALVKAVVGGHGVTRMPGPIPCGLVAFGLILIIFAIHWRGATLANLVLWVGSVILILRGLIVWLPMWRKMTPVEPFASNDRRYFGPLCLALGLGLLVLVA